MCEDGNPTFWGHPVEIDWTQNAGNIYFSDILLFSNESENAWLFSKVIS